MRFVNLVWSVNWNEPDDCPHDTFVGAMVAVQCTRGYYVQERKERSKELCEQAAYEPTPKLLALIQEISQLLDEKQKRLDQGRIVRNAPAQ